MIGEEQLRRIQHFWSNNSRSGIQEIEVSHRWPAALLQNLDRQQLGALGERIASKWAQLGGFKILHKSLRHTGFELDLVIQRMTAVHVLEIKTRLNPHEAPDMNLTQGWMNKRKMAAIMRGMNYLSETIPSGFGSIESLILDLIAIDIDDKSQKIRAYRWPNVSSC